MFIAKSYDLHLDAPACEPGAEYWNATALFAEDISPVFPYLNAQWRDAVFSPVANQITLRFEGRAVALKAREITISNLPDRDAAAIEMEKVVAAINRTWMDRENLTPLDTARKRLVAMEVYRLLPQTNCRACGETTCFAFATKITIGEAKMDACAPLLQEEGHAAKHDALAAMLADAAR
jgi:ArsR family metal-binding transcriptional regulator